MPLKFTCINTKSGLFELPHMAFARSHPLARFIGITGINPKNPICSMCIPYTVTCINPKKPYLLNMYTLKSHLCKP